MLIFKRPPADYFEYTRKKLNLGLLLLSILVLLFIYTVSLGPFRLTFREILTGIVSIFSSETMDKSSLIVWRIRLPRITAATIAGIGLAVSGLIMQCVLKNPLASPYTLGISHGAAFGAAFAIVFLNAGEIHSSTADAVIVKSVYITPISAFTGSLIGVVIILVLAKWRRLAPGAVILSGIAMGSLFIAGTTLIEYFATDMEVASIVFWTFGDIGRASWKQIGVMSIVIFLALVYFMLNRWNYNAMESGDEVAEGLGVSTQSVRLISMVVSSLVVSVVVSFMGIIGFIGLVAPHSARRIIGNDHRFLVPISSIFGGILLLLSDTLARNVISPVILPVGVITSFMGAPLFIYLLARSRR